LKINIEGIARPPQQVAQRRCWEDAMPHKKSRTGKSRLLEDRAGRRRPIGRIDQSFSGIR
jgi:hypothetical protein